MTIYSKTVKWKTALLAMVFSHSILADGISWSTEGPSAPDTGDGTEFGRTFLSFTMPLGERERGQESIRSAFHVDITEFRWSGTTAAQNDYYWISMPLEYRQQRGRSSEFIVHAEPGFMTDMNVLSSDSLAVNLDLIGRVYRRSGSFWQLGLTVDRTFGDLNPRPIIGVAFKPTRDTEVLLGFPKTRIQTAWNEALSSYLRIAPEGGVWEEEIDGQTGTYRTAYSNWKLGFGVDFHWQRGFWLNAEIGQLRHRRIWSYDADATKRVATPAEDRYWQVGIDLRY
ncbi:MAG: hypothetical protein CMI02_19265 [Oceanospirillaceae bacterium]|nr:hypothetical protein [Oceanospirillaceae bacterium]MBT14169.1 hypothetical protein [Oceanospirillaceae bacterium]|tara:strand:+ start:21477 stop:22325 length:849 start_codon:yes stop_codon:yes gene_type:complete